MWNPSPSSSCCRRSRPSKGRTVCVSVRVNPDVDAKTHAKIATGKSENKFGIPISRAREVYAHAGKLKGVRVAGVDMHIGSQITDLQPFDDAFALLSDFVRTLRADGHHIEHVDLGGGLGIPYREDNEPPPDPAAYAAVVKRATRDLDCTLIFEPGRMIVGNAGILVARVHLREARRGEELRHRRCRDERSDPPDALRGASRYPAGEGAGAERARASSRTWSARSARPATIWRSTATCRSRSRATSLAFMTAGAYGAVQAGTYNTRALVPEVLVNGAEWALVRPRLEVDALIALDRMPAWL